MKLFKFLFRKTRHNKLTKKLVTLKFQVESLQNIINVGESLVENNPSMKVLIQSHYVLLKHIKDRIHQIENSIK